jgi:uncharacterized SAM-binding protein YcdF (DUF218 family)
MRSFLVSFLTQREPIFNEEAQRILKTASLAQRYPEAKIVLTGGVPDDNPQALSESDVSFMALEALGVSFTGSFLTLQVPGLYKRTIKEKKSHNTHENVMYSMELVEVQENERWLLVTSATHMSRSLGVFKKMGWKGEIIPGKILQTGEVKVE